MDQNVIENLNKRNERIIAAIIKKAKVICPGSIALIGVTGSFASGDFNEKSDLDLLIVINDDDGWKIAQCFILEDIAHDIYCQYWEQLEQLAEYDSPYVSKLLSAQFVYIADEKYMNRYIGLRKKLIEKMKAPLCAEDLNKIRKHLSQALESYALCMLSDELGECRINIAQMLYYSEFALYQLNKTYVKHGVKHMPAEIGSFEKLPDAYPENVKRLIMSETAEQAKTNAAIYIKSVKELIKTESERSEQKKEINADALCGSYEECISNWRSKIYNAAHDNDVYASFGAMAACQMVYDDFYNEFDIPRNTLADEFLPDNLAESAQAFDRALERHRALYEKTGAQIMKYDSIDEFEKDYLKNI